MTITLTNDEHAALMRLAAERGELTDQCATNLVREALAR